LDLGLIPATASEKHNQERLAKIRQIRKIRQQQQLSTEKSGVGLWPNVPNGWEMNQGQGLQPFASGDKCSEWVW